MPDHKSAPGSLSLLLLALGVVAFVSPVLVWWLETTPAWFLPFIGWFGYIVVVAISSLSRRRHGL
ncbi:hypothetical protein [Spiribacter pallidus]|jgi:hypothetical protein|uniref:DUF3311 domain-containing protein n=1 Tax=Spiribacter pallidus TaxID=1987936 RepID=A0ABV3TBP0_9GAMM